MLLPSELVFIMLLINNRRVVGDLRNGLGNNIIGWGSLGLVSTAVGALLLNQVFGFMG